MLTEKHPWSRGDMDRYGRSIRDGTEFDRELATDIRAWHFHLLDEVKGILESALSGADIGYFSITKRVKTEISTRQKLQRQSMKLSQMQDFAGARVTLRGGLREQADAVAAVVEAFEKAGARSVRVKEILDVPHSGYRAVHLHVTAEAGRTEVQLRTETQAQWANAYELLADLTGREVRYGENSLSGPVAGVVTWMQMTSDSTYEWEKSVQVWEDAQRESVVPVDPGLQVFGGVKAHREFIVRHRNALVELLSYAEDHFRRLKEAQR